MAKIIDFFNFVERFNSISSYTFYMNILYKLKNYFRFDHEIFILSLLSYSIN